MVTLKPEQVKPATEFGVRPDTKYLQGLDTLDKRMLILVDIEALIPSRDMERVERAAA